MVPTRCLPEPACREWLTRESRCKDVDGLVLAPVCSPNICIHVFWGRNCPQQSPDVLVDLVHERVGVWDAQQVLTKQVVCGRQGDPS
jgi:hypothetical protein